MGHPLLKEPPDHSFDDQAEELASEFAGNSTQSGDGRVLVVRPAGGPTSAESLLRDAGYRVGRIAVTPDGTHLADAAATFQPDVIYVSLAEPIDTCIKATAQLAEDERTSLCPIVTLLPEGSDPALVAELYGRTGCDFFRSECSEIELLARTHLLVKLAKRLDKELPGESLHGRVWESAANDSPADRISLHDPITGLHSRAYLRHRVPAEVSRARRYDRNLSVVVLMCRAAADDESAATRVAQALRNRLREADVIGRLDADLFFVALPETAVDAAHALAKDLRESLGAGGLKISIGVAALDDGEGGSTHSAATLARAAAQAADIERFDILFG